MEYSGGMLGLGMSLTDYPVINFFDDRPRHIGGNELREDGTISLREDSTKELRE